MTTAKKTKPRASKKVANTFSANASTTDVRRAAQSWSDEVIQCRTRGHQWEQYNAYHIKRYRYWHVVFHCANGCGCEKWEEWNEFGVVLAKTMRYPIDEQGNQLYLMPSGTGRIDAETKGVLRLEAVTRVGFIEITEATQNDETTPHSAHTRAFLESEGLWESA